ncbi:MAG: large conductance mechanosensitive channel [Verrucomicrobiota bacterium]|jgi:large conductance mechanosensitive channel
MSSSKVGESAKSFLQEFRDFAMKGSVIDLAVGVVIGVAFGKIVSSLVSYVVMPPIGLLLGRVDFSSLFVNLSTKPAASLKEATDKGLPVLAYGAFLNTVIEFLIIALVLFVVIQQVSRYRKPAPPKGPSAEEKLLTEIRDLLKAERSGPVEPEKPAA